MALFKKIVRSFTKFFTKKAKKVVRRFPVVGKGTKRKKRRTNKLKHNKGIKKVILPKATAKAAQAKEESIGEITHYFSRIRVVVVKVARGIMKVGDEIHILGRKTDFRQKINSIQIESVDVKEARKGQLVGLKVVKEASPGDKVYRKK